MFNRNNPVHYNIIYNKYGISKSYACPKHSAGLLCLARLSTHGSISPCPETAFISFARPLEKSYLFLLPHGDEAVVQKLDVREGKYGRDSVVG